MDDDEKLARAIMDRIERDGSVHMSSLVDEIRRGRLFIGIDWGLKEETRKTWEWIEVRVPEVCNCTTPRCYCGQGLPR